MKTIAFKITAPTQAAMSLWLGLLFLILVWVALPAYIRSVTPTAGLLDTGIWQLLLFSMLCFTGLTILSWWLLQKCWLQIGFPPVNEVVSQFKKLTLWQQFVFFWASFALLLLTGSLSLLAIF